jgi:hypothetical protein
LDNGKAESIRPWRVVLAAWLVLAVIVVVFATDIDRYAQAGEDLGAQALAPVTPRLAAAAQALGVTALRDGAAGSMRSVYASAPSIGSAAALPEVALQAAVGQPAPVAQIAADAASAPAVAAQDGKIQRVLIIGDSFIEAQIGSAIEDILSPKYGLTVRRFGQRSTGLSRPDYFDWPKKINELKAAFQPDLIVGSWGANDCQALTSPEGKVVAKFGTAGWDSGYASRVADVVQEMTAGGCKAVVIGLPSMHSRALGDRIKHLNEVAQKAAEGDGATYLPLWPLSVDKNGNYLASITVGGQEKLLRMSDGVHFSGPGAAFVADKLCSSMAKQFGWAKQ